MTNETTPLSPAASQLAAINEVLAGRIPKDVESYAIEGRSLTRVPLKELYQIRTLLMHEVAAEARAARGATGIGRVIKTAVRYV